MLVGHHLVFEMIEGGGQVKQRKKNFFDRFHQLAGRGLELAGAHVMGMEAGRGLRCRSPTTGRLNWPPHCQGGLV